MRFTKMHGAGNDYVYVDCMRQPPPKDPAALARKISDRHFGVGGDGLVLARSAFHHSVNYRSVVILGKAQLVEDPAEKMEALRIFTEHVMKGRWNDVRIPTEQELKATTVLSLPLEEVSAKVRTGGPIDDEPDYALPVWAGVLPLETVAKTPLPDAQRKNDPPIPEYLKNYKR